MHIRGHSDHTFVCNIKKIHPWHLENALDRRTNIAKYKNLTTSDLVLVNNNITVFL
jgi:hypothetical protein